MPFSISGKWWGRRDVTPVIGLHGFEDNAGTFDRLAPMLNVPAFFAWDAPGHGKSSHAPPGMVYTFTDFIMTLRRIVHHFGWQKFSIVGHSFGSCMGHIYSSMYPLEVDKFVSIDCARTFMSLFSKSGGLPLLRKIVEKTINVDKSISKDPPAYSREELAKLFCAATYNSVAIEHVESLLLRGVREHPSQANGYYFTRDPKLRNGDFHRPNNEMLEASAKNIKCHVLTILGKEGFINMAGDESAAGSMFSQLEKLVEKSAASYQRVIVDGTHHLHLNTPEKVAPLINKFLS